MTATRAGFVAIIGAPNAGKSTLVEPAGRLQGLHRHAQGADDTLPHPRRHDAQGQSQVVLVDTPGIFAPSAGSTAPW
jgi:GTP-binding protein Era